MDFIGRERATLLRYWQPLLLCGILVVFLPLLLLHLLPNVRATSSGIWQQYTYTGPAGSRPYFVYTPANYQVGKAVPLLVMLHGCAQTPVDFATSTTMDQLADQHQFIALYPQQRRTDNQEACWNWFDPTDQGRGSGEPAILAGIVQTVEQTPSQWRIDPHQVYVAGFSAGAAMAVILGATYPDLFAALSVESGLEYKAATTATDGFPALRQGGPDPRQQGQVAYTAMGNAARVVPTMSFHGTSDSLVYPINGDQAVQQWMQTDHLASKNTYTASFTSPTSTTTGQVAGGRSYTVYTWNDTTGNEVQEYWVVKGMGHAWSGGSNSGSFTDPEGPSATEAIYHFFMSHAAGSMGSGGASDVPLLHRPCHVLVAWPIIGGQDHLRPPPVRGILIRYRIPRISTPPCADMVLKSSSSV